MKRVALYDPYLDTLGGGEKFVLEIISVISEMGWEVTIFWDKDLSRDIAERFSIKIKNIEWRKREEISSSLKAYKTLKGFDCFFCITDGSYFASGAKKNYVYAMVPDAGLYKMNLANKLKLHNYKFLTHSDFTKRWLQRFGIESKTIPPHLENHQAMVKKEKIILSVGRFFKHLHNKRHDVAITAFKKLKDRFPIFKDYKLILAGGLKDEDRSYFSELKALAGHDKGIIFKTNIPGKDLENLYAKSTYFWHFAGYDVNENQNPQAVEHLGLTPLEAISWGVIPFCVDKGGTKETITDGETGFLFEKVDELIDKMTTLESDPDLKGDIIRKGQKSIEMKYNYQIFKNVVKDLL